MPTKTKTKKEVYPVRYSEESNGVNWNTHKSMTYCKCGALGVDGCEFYACPVVNAKHSTTGVRLIGNEADREEVKKERKNEN